MAGEAVTPITNTSVLNNPQNISQWLGILEQLFPQATNTSGNSSSSTTNSSAADGPLQAMIAQLMSQLNNGASGFQSLLAPIFQQFKEGALPQIQGQANAGGGVYNSTTKSLLQNDALSRAVAQGGAVVATQQNAIQAQIANLLSTLARSTQQTNAATQQNQTQQKSGQASNAAKAALGAAAAGQAAKLLNLKPSETGPKFNSELDPDKQGTDFDSKNDKSDGGSSDTSLDNSIAIGDFAGNPDDPFGIGGYDSNFGASDAGVDTGFDLGGFDLGGGSNDLSGFGDGGFEFSGGDGLDDSGDSFDF